MFNNKNILITGGTGTFGREITQVLLREYIPNKIIIYSRGELKQYEMAKEFDDKCMRYFIGDVRDAQRLKKAMKDVDYVIHIASINRASIAEYNPMECIKTNINGAQNVIDAAIENKVNKVIAISNDKASNPGNLYGATKLASDKLFIAANNLVGFDKVFFSVVRYISFEDNPHKSEIKQECENFINQVIPIKNIECLIQSKEETVGFVLDCFKRMQGGEIYFPKISLKKLESLINNKDLSSKSLLLSRIHNILLSISDNHLTYEFKGYYLIVPTIQFTTKKDYSINELGEKGNKILKIPYGKQHIFDDDIKDIVNVLQSDFLTTGPKVREFEKKISEYSSAKYCVAVSNGTAALHLASLVLLEEGDNVLTTPNSFLATSNAILYAKAKPIFVDICEDGNIDLDICEDYLKNDNKIKAIYAVHFSGNPVNQDKLKYLKEKYNIKILEDCAHSLGASFNGIKAGSCSNSDISIFSFHPVKNMTTGEGGAITTNSKEIYKKLLSLRNHGMIKTKDMRPWEYEMQNLGFNYRITDIQSTLGISQLKKLDNFIEKRQELAKRYDEKFKGSRVKSLYSFTKNSSYHIYVVKVDLLENQDIKEKFFNILREENIGIQLHYLPINKQPFYLNLGFGSENTPIMDDYYKKAFSLPLYPSLSEDEQDYVVKKVFEVLNELS